MNGKYTDGVKKIIRPVYYKLVHSHVKQTCRRTFMKFQNFHDMYLNQKCFIVANGPSLTIEDLEVICNKKIISFGMNRIYKLYDKTKWRPTFYITQDPHLIRMTYRETIDAVKDSIVFEKSTGEKNMIFPMLFF